MIVMMSRPTAAVEQQQKMYTASNDHLSAAVSSGTAAAAMMMMRQAATTTSPGVGSPTATIVVTKPAPHDVLCGKDKSYRTWKGNELFRDMVAAYLPLYLQATSKKDKMKLTKQVVKSMQASYQSRFLKPLGNASKKEEQLWQPISDLLARDKASHALRFASKATNSVAIAKKKAGIILPTSQSPSLPSCFLRSAELSNSLTSLTATLSCNMTNEECHNDLFSLGGADTSGGQPSVWGSNGFEHNRQPALPPLIPPGMRGLLDNTASAGGDPYSSRSGSDSSFRTTVTMSSVDTSTTCYSRSAASSASSYGGEALADDDNKHERGGLLSHTVEEEPCGSLELLNLRWNVDEEDLEATAAVAASPTTASCADQRFATISHELNNHRHSASAAATVPTRTPMCLYNNIRHSDRRPQRPARSGFPLHNSTQDWHDRDNDLFSMSQPVVLEGQQTSRANGHTSDAEHGFDSFLLRPLG